MDRGRDLFLRKRHNYQVIVICLLLKMKTPRELCAIFGVTKWQLSFLKENNGTINMNDFLECTERHCNSKYRLLTA